MRVADTLRALKIRESKSWKVIDWCLSEHNKDHKTKLQAAEFILKRLYPEKSVLTSEDEKGNIVPLHVYIPELKSES